MGEGEFFSGKEIETVNQKKEKGWPLSSAMPGEKDPLGEEKPALRGKRGRKKKTVSPAY